MKIILITELSQYSSLIYAKWPHCSTSPWLVWSERWLFLKDIFEFSLKTMIVSGNERFFLDFSAVFILASLISTPWLFAWTKVSVTLRPKEFSSVMRCVPTIRRISEHIQILTGPTPYNTTYSYLNQQSRLPVLSHMVAICAFAVVLFDFWKNRNSTSVCCYTDAWRMWTVSSFYDLTFLFNRPRQVCGYQSGPGNRMKFSLKLRRPSQYKLGRRSQWLRVKLHPWLATEHTWLTKGPGYRTRKKQVPLHCKDSHLSLPRFYHWYAWGLKHPPRDS